MCLVSVHHARPSHAALAGEDEQIWMLDSTQSEAACTKSMGGSPRTGETATGCCVAMHVSMGRAKLFKRPRHHHQKQFVCRSVGTANETSMPNTDSSFRF